MGVDQLTELPSSFRQKDLVFVKSSADDTKVSIPGFERPWLFEAEGVLLPNHDTSRILPVESHMKVTNPLVTVIDSSVTEYDLDEESSVCSTPLPLLEKLASVTINELTSTPAKGNKIVLAFKKNSALAAKLKNMKTKDEIPLSVVMKELYDLKLQININQSSYFRNNNPQQCDIKKPIWYLNSECSRNMTGVKSHLHKYVEQSGLKVVFGDDSTCTTEEYGYINCNASESLNWIWHKRLAHLNFITTNQLAKQNLVIGLPSLVYSKDKLCSSCKKRKHHVHHMKRGSIIDPVSKQNKRHVKKKSHAPETIINEYLRVLDGYSILFTSSDNGNDDVGKLDSFQVEFNRIHGNRHVPIDASIELVILASDGLWKVMSNLESIEMVKSIKDPLAAAKRLTSEALARNSKDDISCIVIRKCMTRSLKKELVTPYKEPERVLCYAWKLFKTMSLDYSVWAGGQYLL
nr:probable protein phosphatase 2C 44 [Tanacetum cinerariifolium]